MKCIKTDGGWINPALVKKYFVAKKGVLSFAVFADDCPIKIFRVDDEILLDDVRKKAEAWLDDFINRHNLAWRYFGVDDNDDIE